MRVVLNSRMAKWRAARLPIHGQIADSGAYSEMTGNKKATGVLVAFFGSSTWARTRDLRINSPALYQLSYRGILHCLQP